MYRWPPPPTLRLLIVFVRVGLGLFAPLGARVKALGSSIEDRRPEPARALVGGAAGGGGAEAGGEGAADGGGGGAALGDACPAARKAACIASGEGPFEAGGGGGGAGDLDGGDGAGALGAAAAGGGGGAEGGADGSAGADDGGGGGGAPGAGDPGNGGGWLGVVEGFRDAGSGGGFLPIGGGGPFIDAEEPGRGRSLGVLRKLAMDGGRAGAALGGGRGGLPGGAGAAPPGGFGAPNVGGFGAEDDRTLLSGSDRYDESIEAPVSTAPRVFRSFGIPPAKSPPSCGAACVGGAGALSRPLWSLLLLARFPGTGGARPPGGLGAPPKPGTGGAPPRGGPPEEPPPEEPPTIGADLSFVTAFLRALPFVMSERRAPCEPYQYDAVTKLPSPLVSSRDVLCLLVVVSQVDCQLQEDLLAVEEAEEGRPSQALAAAAEAEGAW